MSHVVATKLDPPMAPRGSIPRPELVARIPRTVRYVAMVAPPGYGKTAFAGEVHASWPAGTAAWLSVDLLDRQPYAFWTHLIASLQRTTAEIDDEPLALLAERPVSDLTFLASLCEQVRTSADPLLLVLDDVDRIDDPDVVAGLERLGEWSDGRLRLVLTGRIDPALPLGRWRAHGSLVEFRQDDLRFDRAASRRFVADLAPGLLSDTEVDELHDRVEGWPVALQVALLVVRNADDPHAALREIGGTDRLLADYLTVEVLDGLSPAQRDVALGLSVLEWFDQEICREVAGSSSVPVVRELRDRHVPIVQLSVRDGFRFHSLVRELLESELRWRDPERHASLHRRAGEAMLRRGDRPAAVRHFLAAGDPDRASDVLAEPALALVDAGRFDELRLALAQLPEHAPITGAQRIIDLALAQLLTGRRREFEQAVRLATAATPVDDELLRSRLRLLAICATTVAGDTPGLRRLADEEDRSSGHDATWYWEPRRAAALVRSSFLLGLGDVEQRLEVLRRSAAPPLVRSVLVPSLESLLALRRGDLPTALRRRGTVADAEHQTPSDAHPTAFEACLAAGWCAWATGSFDEVRDLTDRLQVHPFAAFPTFRMQVAALVTERLVRTGAAVTAIDLLDQVDPADLDGLAVRVGHALARGRALHGAGRHLEVGQLLASVEPSPERDVLLAWSAAHLGRPEAAHRFLRGCEHWPTPLRIEAMLAVSLLAQGSGRRRQVAAAIALAARDGWVAPLLGHGPEIDNAVRAQASTSHPTLAAAHHDGRTGDPATPRPPASSPGPIDLTEREMTLLELLPTHLSYGQLGERLYVSVNTIKSNLKSIYRKLGASSRDEAIRAARAAGLLQDDL